MSEAREAPNGTPSASNRAPIGHALIVEDDRLFARTLALMLEEDGLVTQVAHDLASAREALKARAFDVLLLDNQLPDGLGLDLARELPDDDERPSVLVITASPRLDDALAAVRAGWLDFLVKPVSNTDVRMSVARAMRTRGLERRLHAAEVAERDPAPRLPSIERICAEITRAESRSERLPPLVLEGETGTGKSWLAREVHKRGRRAQGPFVALNCAALPATLLEVELFGSEPGAFTGARAKAGLCETASGGTLFLDEVGELPLELQPKLLTMLEGGEVRRVGGLSVRRVDCRIVVATNRELAAEVAAGRFREDLFYRLDVLRYAVPPLRERRAEIPTLVEALLHRLDARGALAPGELERLVAHDWPGNLRELRNVVERTVLVTPSGRALEPSRHLLRRGASQEARRPDAETTPIASAPMDARDASLLPPSAASTTDSSTPSSSASSSASSSTPSSNDTELDETLESVERRHILATLARHGGRRDETARALGIGVATLRRKLRGWGLPAAGGG
jgi:DNA-binding NtrC family response regulator